MLIIVKTAGTTMKVLCFERSLVISLPIFVRKARGSEPVSKLRRATRRLLKLLRARIVSSARMSRPKMP